MTDYTAIRSAVSVQSAYQKGRATQETGTSLVQDADSQPTSFGDMVAKNATQAVETVRKGDATALAGLTGQAGIQQVVEATMAMESTVQMSVALRDKLVEAYQEIIRMPV